MSWVRIWIHFVFSTKNREDLLTRDIITDILQHIKKNAEEKEIWIDCLNGHSDHIHCLISLNKEQTISKVAQLIKGESSYWINKNHLTKTKFNWQDDYWAVSVSESNIESVKSYIRDQEAHHKKKSFAEEVNEFMDKYGWNVLKKE